MHFKSILALFLLVLLSPLLQAQNSKKADELFQAHDYQAARSQYEALLRKQPTNALYLYRTARCAQELGDYAVAEELFIKAGEKYPLRNFFLAEIYFEQWRMQEAIALYNAFLPSIHPDHERWSIVQERLQQAQTIARYLKHVSRIEIDTVQRMPRADMLHAYSLNEQCGTIMLDSIGSTYSTQRADRQYFSIRTPFTAQATSTDTTQASAPSTRTLLVRRQRLLDQWEEPDTLSPSVNNGTQNVYPYVLTDGATLYFSSDCNGGLGGLDIYMTRYNASLGQWLPAENIGMPFNSPADDYLYAADEQNGIGYFATNRHCPNTDSVDVYRFKLSERQFLRGVPDGDLVRLAKLDSLILVADTTSAPFHASASAVPTQAEDSIFFVLNDDITYTQLSDFRSDSARVLYRQYILLTTQQEQATTMLDDLRQQYYHANDSIRSSLRARIPMLSAEIEKRKRTIHSTLNQIRELENR